MVINENHCVDCGLPCIGNDCPYKSVEVHYCDYCGEYAICKIDGEDLCKKCANNYFDEDYNSLSIKEKCDLFNSYFEEV